MPELEGRLVATGRVAIAVARYHERFTLRLLDGARTACREAGIRDENIDVLWVNGAFELGAVAHAAAAASSYSLIVALGIVIRGETPHFDFVAGETSAALARVGSSTGVPVGFGLLTCDTLEQATERSGLPSMQ